MTEIMPHHKMEKQNKIIQSEIILRYRAYGVSEIVLHGISTAFPVDC